MSDLGLTLSPTYGQYIYAKESKKNTKRDGSRD